MKNLILKANMMSHNIFCWLDEHELYEPLVEVVEQMTHLVHLIEQYN